MSYQSEHKRMKPVLDLADKLAIATNPAPEALYDKHNSGFNVWCTPTDHPKGFWVDVEDYMFAGAFAKPCAFVGSCYWGWTDDVITSVQVNTTAYILKDCHPDFKYKHRTAILNRPADLKWIIEKITQLFEQAGVAVPKIITAN